MSEDAAKLRQLIALANQSSAPDYGRIYDEIVSLCGSVAGDAAIEVLRACLQPLDETAKDPHSDLLSHLFPMFQGFARFAPD